MMTYDLTVIQPDGKEEHRVVKGLVPLDLLKSIVGGSIETVPHFTTFKKKRCIAYCNDEARVTNLPFNTKASELWRAQAGFITAPYNQIYGPLAIIQRRQP